jgi:hypothetical protein
MAELNPNQIVFGVKKETVRGTAETLVEADFNQQFLDAEQLQNAPDHAKAGKAANGTLINTAKSYSRTRGATGAVRMEIKALADPLVAPNYFETTDVSGFKNGVIDAGVNDNVEFYYDGKPSCATTTGYIKGVKGAVIADAKIGIEGAGAPLLLTGTVSGAFHEQQLTATEITPTEDAGDCVQGIGMTALLGGVLLNFTKFEWSSNLGATPVTDMSDATLISHYNLAEGGEPTFTFSAIPVQATADDDWSDLFGNVVDTELVLENDDVKIIIDIPQKVDLQDMNETGVMVRDYTFDCGGIRVQYK